MVLMYLSGYMRGFPTFPRETELNNVNCFIDGAKMIWDAWAGPRFKNIVQQD